MADRMELLESALNSLPDGIALLDQGGQLVLWNEAAEAITGYGSADLRAAAVLEALQPLLDPPFHGRLQAGAGSAPERGALVRARHKLGHDLPLIARTLVLHDGLGERVGLASLFHPAQRLDALPHGEPGDDPGVETGQADLEERLQSEFEDFERDGQPLGVLWVSVDQGPELRKTHGAAACQAMLEKVRHALALGLRPADELGRWGDDEFLVIAHERTPEMLSAHAHTLAGLARTADFRWWGDRLSLTVSVGAAQAEPGEALPRLLKRARRTMEAGARDGGNRVTLSPRAMSEEIDPGQPAGDPS